MIKVVFTTHLDQNLMIKVIKMVKIKKPLNIVDYLKSLSQKAKDG